MAYLPAMTALAPAIESMALTNADIRKPVGPVVQQMRSWSPGEAGTDTDDELLNRIAKDDDGAFRRLVERHIDRAYALALRILRNGADAEDVVQDSLLKVWTQRGRWEGGRAKFSTWLYRVVTNRCIDLRRHVRSDEIGAAGELVDEKPDALTTMHRQEVGNLLEAAIQGLPEQQRIAIVLSYHENLGNAEIAEIMETTIAAVESLLKRGRQQLRHSLRRSRGDILQAFGDD